MTSGDGGARSTPPRGEPGPERPRPPGTGLGARAKLKPAPNWTDTDLERLTEITPADQQAGANLWRARAPKPFKDLLDAETDAVSLE